METSVTLYFPIITAKRNKPFTERQILYYSASMRYLTQSNLCYCFLFSFKENGQYRFCNWKLLTYTHKNREIHCKIQHCIFLRYL